MTNNPADNQMLVGFSPWLLLLPVRPCQASGGLERPSHLEMKPKASPERWSGLAQGEVCWAWLGNVAELGPWGISCPLPCL